MKTVSALILLVAASLSMAVLSYDGKSYPRNPSMPPARKTTAVRGDVIIANTEDSVPLYD